MKEEIIAFRIAAHAGDIAKGIKGARDWDNAMSKARADLDWETMFNLAIDGEKHVDTERNPHQTILRLAQCVERCVQLEL